MRRPLIFIILLLVCGCNKKSESLSYNDSISTKDFDGYSRDMYIQNDTLFAVNEDEGLLIYKLEIDTLINTLTFSSLHSDSAYYQNKSWDLSGILFSDMKKIIILDGFECVRFADLSDVLSEENTSHLFQDLQCASPNHHSSRFTINNGNEKIDIFTLVRKVSSYSTSDISAIYQSKWIDGFIDQFLVIDSLNYDLKDVHYMNQKLIIANSNNNSPEFQIYDINITEGLYADTLIFVNTIETPAIPNALYSTGDTLFMGMGDHAGVKVYNLSNADTEIPISEFASGFSVKEVFWDPLDRLLLLSCGYQGVVVLELDGNMQEVDSWILNTSYAYASRNYRGNIIVATRKGLEIIILNSNQ